MKIAGYSVASRVAVGCLAKSTTIQPNGTSAQRPFLFEVEGVTSGQLAEKVHGESRHGQAEDDREAPAGHLRYQPGASPFGDE